MMNPHDDLLNSEVPSQTVLPEQVRESPPAAVSGSSVNREVAALCARLRDPDASVVTEVATELGRLKAPDAVAPLCRELLRLGRTLPDFVYGRQEEDWTSSELRLVEQRAEALGAMVWALTEIRSPYAAGTFCELIGEAFWRTLAVAAAEGLERLVPQLSPEQLAAAIPVLKSQLPPWVFEAKEKRETFRRVLNAVQARKREIGSLPLPDTTPGNGSDQLPRPAEPPATEAAQFPVPSDRKHDETGPT